MKHYKLIGLVIAINTICLFIPHDYYQYLTVQSNETEVLNTLKQSLTYMFMSENWAHFLANTLVLIAFSRSIVIVINDNLFLVYYLVWGLLIGILNYLIASNFEYSYLIGNSGVIYAFLGYLVVFIGNTELTLLFRFKTSFTNLMVVLISLSIIQIATKTNVYGNIAHINGFILGLITAKIYKKIHIWQTN